MKKAKKQLKKQRKGHTQIYFPASKELIRQAYSATKKAKLSRKFKNKLTRKKALNNMKIKEFGKFLENKIHDLAKQFPNIDEMTPFYLDLLELIANVDVLKENLAKLYASFKVIKRIKSEYGRKIFASQSIEQDDRYWKEFQGRSISVIKKLDKPLEKLKVESKKLKEMPVIDFKAPTIVLSGFPNVGKSTILRRITSSKPKVSAYQFTTKQINMGHFEFKYRKIQVLDTPGLLDREKLNTIEKKALASLKHLASIIVFIIDPTLGCGYSLKEQVSLMKHLKTQFKGKKFVTVINKADAASKLEMENALKETTSAVIDGNKELGIELKKDLEKQLVFED
ncbi:50S ribosome-binding GTPase [archaeon]|nr:50S ribosome-binding GTPase [archaeon]